jgi:2-hydroxyglutarate dehydrogenase
VSNGSETEALFDLVVVGAGIVGLACARALMHRHPDWRIAIVEKENDIAQHQSGHNSGVIHAGIYYTPGSLKARLCVEGARMLYRFCEEREIPVRRIGKVIVATNRAELPGLRELERRGRENRVPGLRWLAASELREIEPRVDGIAALHSPATGVVDYPAICRALAGDLRSAGHEIRTGCEVRTADERGDRLVIGHSGGVLSARRALFCAGAWADRLARRAGAPEDPRIIPFRGAYLLLRPQSRELVRGLIYPVPDPRLPFLGVHLTRHIDDAVSIGPTALVVGARDAYRLTTVRWSDLADSVAWPGTRKMAWRFRSSAWSEVKHLVRRRTLVAAAQRFIPELQLRDVHPGPVGVRAQALSRDGSLVDDFVFSATGRALHVRNAPSPAATSALAIAEHVADSFEQRFGLAAAQTVRSTM